MAADSKIMDNWQQYLKAVRKIVADSKLPRYRQEAGNAGAPLVAAILLLTESIAKHG